MWDVFLSHASEDAAFARQLCDALQQFGLHVWFDEMCLVPGDSLRRKIDEGLANSRFGIVVLSPSFIKKGWTQWELDGLVSRDIAAGKVLIPVWHGLTAHEVRQYSPPLADRVAIKSDDDSLRVARGVLRAIHVDRIKNGRPPTFEMSNGLQFVILPIRPRDGMALGLAVEPMTNARYKALGFTPQGDRFIDGVWKGPFNPWEDPDFNLPDQPVVCLSLPDAIKCAQAVGGFVPTTDMWRFAVGEGATLEASLHALTGLICDKALRPAPLSAASSRRDSWGFVDLYGNVWEWSINQVYLDSQNTSSKGLMAAFPAISRMFPSLGPSNSFAGHVAVSAGEIGVDSWTAGVRNVWMAALGGAWGQTKEETLVAEADVVGGGYLDDLSKVSPILRVSNITDGARTKHADLGVRIAAMIPKCQLAPVDQLFLDHCEPEPLAFWLTACASLGLSSHPIHRVKF